MYAEQDELVPATAVRRWIEACAARPDVTAIAEAGHMFHGRLAPIRAAVDGFLTRLQRAAG